MHYLGRCSNLLISFDIITLVPKRLFGPLSSKRYLIKIAALYALVLILDNLLNQLVGHMSHFTNQPPLSYYVLNILEAILVLPAYVVSLIIDAPLCYTFFNRPFIYTFNNISQTHYTCDYNGSPVFIYLYYLLLLFYIIMLDKYVSVILTKLKHAYLTRT